MIIKAKADAPIVCFGFFFFRKEIPMDENYSGRHIPPNYDNGINLLGLHFKPLFLIEGIVFGVSGGVLTYLLLVKVFLVNDTWQAIGYCILIGGAFLALGITGLNGEPLTTFLINFLRFIKRRRTDYYNPKVKVASQELFTETEELPRDKFLSLIEKIKLNSEKNSNTDIYEEFDPELMEFYEEGEDN